MSLKLFDERGNPTWWFVVGTQFVSFIAGICFQLIMQELGINLFTK